MKLLVSELLLVTAGMFGSLLPLASAELPAKDAGGWLDLFPGKNLKGWQRVPIAPDTKLASKNPWKVAETRKVLLCDGVGVKEMLLYEKEFGDGTFHVEWRFRKVPDKHDYNSGVYVRTALDGKIWHQSQVAHLEKAPLRSATFSARRSRQASPTTSRWKGVERSWPIDQGSGIPTTSRARGRWSRSPSTDSRPRCGRIARSPAGMSVCKPSSSSLSSGT